MKTEKEKMLSGELYRADDVELKTEFKRAKEITYQINTSLPNQVEKRKELVRKLFNDEQLNAYIEPPFRIDYGINTSIGEHFYANYECIFLDIAPILIGNNVLLGPRVGLFTAGHPIDAGVRGEGLEFGKPINIGNDVWIGAGTIVNPGVSIGNNVVIGSGSVVTKDIPDNVVAVGNPCKVLRPITDDDKQYWVKEKEQYLRS